jgi:phage terminase small subunit
MRQRGRKSAALLTFPAVDGSRPRITAPASLTKSERSLFAQLAADAGHLAQSDAPLLASYVQAVLLSRRAGRDPGSIDAWEKVTRVMTSLATKLRLTPQARTDPKTVGRRQAEASYYDRMDD